MSTPLPPAQHGAVPAGIKATPSGWPPASLDPGCGRRTPAATGSPAQGENPTNSGLYGFRGLPRWSIFGCRALVSFHVPSTQFQATCRSS